MSRVVRYTSEVVFACHSAACRPPTSGGTGGSNSKGGGGGRSTSSAGKSGGGGASSGGPSVRGGFAYASDGTKLAKISGGGPGQAYRAQYKGHGYNGSTRKELLKRLDEAHGNAKIAKETGFGKKVGTGGASTEYNMTATQHKAFMTLKQKNVKAADLKISRDGKVTAKGIDTQFRLHKATSRGGYEVRGENGSGIYSGRSTHKLFKTHAQAKTAMVNQIKKASEGTDVLTSDKVAK